MRALRLSPSPALLVSRSERLQHKIRSFRHSFVMNSNHFISYSNGSKLRVFSEGLALAAENGVMMGGTQPAASMMGGGTMMGGAAMMGGAGVIGGAGMMGGLMPAMDLDHLATMPADGVFSMMSQTCAACHTLFRTESQ